MRACCTARSPGWSESQSLIEKAGDEAAESEPRRGKRGVESSDLTWPSSREAAQSTSVEGMERLVESGGCGRGEGVSVRVNKQTNKQIIDLQEILSGPLTALYVHTLWPRTSSQ